MRRGPARLDECLPRRIITDGAPHQHRAAAAEPDQDDVGDVRRGATHTLTDRGQPVADTAPDRSARCRTGREVAAAFLARLGPDPIWAGEAARLGLDDECCDPWDAAR